MEREVNIQWRLDQEGLGRRKNLAKPLLLMRVCPWGHSGNCGSALRPKVRTACVVEWLG
jgi:hypothetical protein